MKNKNWLYLLLVILLFLCVGCKKTKEDTRPLIKFDTDGGTSVSDQHVDVGGNVVTPANPTKDGYIFVAWTKGDYQYDFSEIVQEGFTLKANWVKEAEDDEVYVYFETYLETEDGEVKGSYVNPIVVKIGEAIGEVENPKMLGYEFVRWLDFVSEKEFKLSTPIEEETTLLASWKAKKKLNIGFDTDGAEEIESMIVYQGDEIGELPRPKKEGYLFVSWMYNGSPVDEKFIPSISCSLKAKFVEITASEYKVIFKDYDGTVLKEEVVKIEESATAPEVNREGYKFLGWDNKFDYIYQETIVNAIYEICKYNVVFFNPANGTVLKEEVVEFGKDATCPVVEETGDDVFAGWDKDYKKVNSNLIVNCVWVSPSELSSEQRIENTINYLNGIWIDETSKNINLPTSYEAMGTEIVWQSNKKTVLDNFGKVYQQYLNEVVTLTASIKHGEKNKNVTFECLVKRKLKDVSNGVTMAYMYSNYSEIDQQLLDTMDVYILAFANFTPTGLVTDLGSYGEQFVKDYIDVVHSRGAYVLMSFRTTATFVNVSSTAENRENFANSIVEAINKYDIDGVDIDWETPTYAQSNDYVEMMKIIYEKVKANNPSHLVTSAILIGGASNFNLRESSKYMDYVNMMSYEMHSHVNTTHHVALYNSSKGGTIYSINSSVSMFIGYGCPKEKIVIGAGFFGRQYKGSKGIGTKAEYQETALSYATIRSSYLDHQTDTMKRYWDDECKVPYIYDSETGLFITYDDPESIKCKADYVKQKGLGGMMCWQTGQDNGELVKAFKDTYKTYHK